MGLTHVQWVMRKIPLDKKAVQYGSYPSTSTTSSRRRRRAMGDKSDPSTDPGTGLNWC